MTRTSATAIVLTVLIAGVLAWLLEGMLGLERGALDAA